MTKTWKIYLVCYWCYRVERTTFQGEENKYAIVNCVECERGVRIQLFDGSTMKSNDIHCYIRESK